LKRLTIEYIKAKTKELAEGYEYLETKYINSKTKMSFKCCKGHLFKATWNNFSKEKGTRCPYCYGNIKPTIEKIKTETQKLAKGYICISEKYKNTRTKLLFSCNKDHEFLMSWGNFKYSKNRCPICYIEDRMGKNNPNWKGGENVVWYNTYAHQIDWAEEVRRDPENKEYLQVRCSNCNKWFNPTNIEVRGRLNVLNGWNNGEQRFYCSDSCKQKCPIYRKVSYIKGKEPYLYRSSQKVWADLVKERDEYQCVKCGRKDLPLIAHHIEGLNVNPLESADIDLGVTLCEKCDKKIHSEIRCRKSDLRIDQLCKG